MGLDFEVLHNKHIYHSTGEIPGIPDVQSILGMGESLFQNTHPIHLHKRTWLNTAALEGINSLDREKSVA